MRKLLLLFVLAGLLFSCRVTKSLVMIKTKENAELIDEEYINKKRSLSSFLNLSNEQKEMCDKIWKEEKQGLNAPVLKNENIAPIIYNSENEFRSILTKEQLNTYLANVPPGGFFLNDHAMNELKRIYIDN